MRSNPSVKRKNFFLDQNKIRKVQKLLNAKTETETIDRALDLALFRIEIKRSLRRAAGKGVVEQVF